MKSDFVLLAEDNLQQLHEIHNSIQRMRDSTLSTLSYGNRGAHNDNIQRLSSSCPSLCPLSLSDGRTGDRAAGSDPDLANCSTNSSPTHFPPVGHQLPQIVLGVDRRRSWTDLEDSRHNRHRCSVGDHLQAQNMVLIQSYIKYFNSFYFYFFISRFCLLILLWSFSAAA